MPEARYRLRSALLESLAEIPSEVRPVLRRGFGLLPSLPRDKWDQVIEWAVESLNEPGLDNTLELIREHFGLSLEDANAIANSVGLMSAMLSAYPEESASSFVDKASTQELIPGEARDVTTKLAEHVVSQRGAIVAAIDKGELASEVLPSLRRLAVTVDVRFKFEEGHPSIVAPVVVLNLDTDAEGQVLWMQLTKVQVNRFVDKLLEAKKRIEEIESWLRGKMPS